jgi:metal-responsive CopG/Arc/MetJ family transcriptional regulator
MKVRTSITLSDDLLEEIDRIIHGSGNRSVFIEEAIRAYIQQYKREMRDRNDLELINRSAEDLNREAGEILLYQAEV